MNTPRYYTMVLPTSYSMLGRIPSLSGFGRVGGSQEIRWKDSVPSDYENLECGIRDAVACSV